MGNGKKTGPKPCWACEGFVLVDAATGRGVCVKSFAEWLEDFGDGASPEPRRILGWVGANLIRDTRLSCGLFAEY